MRDELRLSSREAHPLNTVIEIGKLKIGDGRPVVIAGPCAVEGEKQIMDAALAVKRSGADILRGGAFKPRTSPYDFQGMGKEGIKLLVKAGREVELPTVSEIVDANDIELFADIDILQVGSRNMQNYSLLKALGRTNKPILLKRGTAATYKELLTSAEYIMSEGNRRVMLCERGIRTFETYTRNTLDIAAVPSLKKLSHLPVIVDPSHATGIADMVAPMAKASIAAGADGLMIEVHCRPDKAMSDGRQSMNPEMFRNLMNDIKNRI